LNHFQRYTKQIRSCSSAGLLLCLLLAGSDLLAQEGRPFGNIPGVSGRFGRGSGRPSSGGSNDSLQHRTGLEDSITISYRLLDSGRTYGLDSSINQFRHFPLPWQYMHLGNVGNAAKSMVFAPNMNPGWDAGFHAYDVYAFRLEDTRFYNTTRPFSELGYVLGSKTEQNIHLLHTQNIRPNWNAAFQYRLVNLPGLFKNQKTNHNNYRLSSWYQGKRKRYTTYFILQSNKLESSENGGLTNESNLDSTQIYRDRFSIPVSLGGDEGFGRNFFSSTLKTGTLYKNTSFFVRQQYDVGKKDSIERDSIVIHLFYPRLRFEHSIRMSKYAYQFSDGAPDTGYYKRNYNFLTAPNPFAVQDHWRELWNDLSIYQFPDAKNPQQFLKLGATLQNLTGTTDAGQFKFYNLIAHGEYRNKTRNKEWDIEAWGQLYAAGFNAGDYSAFASIKKFLSKKWGFIEVGFHNVNRSPSFIYDARSSFSLVPGSGFKKENNTHIYAAVDNPTQKLQLSGHYYLAGNFTYFNNFYTPAQEATLVNVLQIMAEKEFRWRKRWHWYVQATVQQTTANAPVNVPLVFIRQRFAFEGVFFKNLNLATGLEIRYNTPFKADGYSPLLGQFYLQNSRTIRNLPDVGAYLHFRIRGFNAFVRAENLNSVSFNNGFGFNNNNIASPGYAYPGLVMRLGIFWAFIN
jgi:Putative porin